MGIVRLSIILLLAYSVAGCATLDKAMRCRLTSARLEAVRHIDLADGIDKGEAEIMAGEYFVHHVSGCGGSGAVVDTGATWVFHPVIGYAAVPMKDEIIIDKKTGKVEMSGYPAATVDDLQRVLQSHLEQSGCCRAASKILH